MSRRDKLQLDGNWSSFFSESIYLIGRYLLRRPARYDGPRSHLITDPSHETMSDLLIRNLNRCPHPHMEARRVDSRTYVQTLIKAEVEQNH